MGGTGAIDGFLATFTQYIDSGFGLVQGDVRWLASVLIAIDITLAGLFWAMAPDEDVLARLIRKTLTIGVFAFLIGHYNNLAQIIYNSFAGLGLKAGGGTITAAQLLQPGKLAQVGIDSGKPILTSISGLMGFTSFFDNFVQIAILMIAWLIVVISFFIMAIQLFVSLIEFKLTTLAGFVLVPFALFGRTAFLAEKVLGNVVSSGVKILALAVIVGIGRPVHHGSQQPADHLRLAHPDPRGVDHSGPVDLRARHRQRLDCRRSSARRRRGGWHKPRRGRHGSGWRWTRRRQPRRPFRRSSVERRRCRPIRGGMIHVPTIQHPLRQDP
jgi:P-type conjugative transfer protein TrbL